MVNRYEVILKTLQNFTNEDHVIVASYNEIAKKSGYCRTVIIHTIRELELTKKIVRHKNTHGGKNFYEVI